MTTSAKVGLLPDSSTAMRSSCCGDRDSEYRGNRSGTSMTSPCRRAHRLLLHQGQESPNQWNCGRRERRWSPPNNIGNQNSIVPPVRL
jgi:hypothetical protein